MEYNMEYSAGKMGDLRSTSAQLCRSDDEDLTLPKGRCVFFFDGRQTQMGPQMGPQSEEIHPSHLWVYKWLDIKIISLFTFFHFILFF